jgi:hypothetical protein
MSVDVGTVYRATLLDVRDGSGNPVQPTGLTFTVLPPDQSIVAPITPVLDLGPMGQVSYHADYLTAQEGLHRGGWAGTVPNITKTDYFNADAYRAIVSLDEIKDHLAIGDTRFDDKLRAVIGAATKLVEDHCGTCVQRTFTDDWITAGDREVLRLTHGPLPTTDSVSLIKSVYGGSPSWAAADLIVNADAGTVRTRNMMGFYYGPWLATYAAGRRVIPPDILQGCREIIWDLWAIYRGTTADQEDPTLEEVGLFEQTLAIPSDYRMPVRALRFLEPHYMPGFA